MKELAKEMIGVFAGVAIAGFLAVCVYGVMQAGVHVYPRLRGSGGAPWILWLVVFLLPETVFLVSTVKLWHKWKPMALGILLTAVVFGTHFTMNIAGRWTD